MSLSQRQTLLLQQLGITPYSLVHPERLQGEYLFKLEPLTRLLIVCNSPIDNHDPLFSDILLALNIEVSAYQILPESRFNLQDITHLCCIWWLGTVVAPETHLTYPCLSSPNLAELAQNTSQKRQLWQQASQYADYFNTTAK